MMMDDRDGTGCSFFVTLLVSVAITNRDKRGGRCRWRAPLVPVGNTNLY
jgi:hypothetical protein